ncbi:hypothetical protein ONS95_007120 [Cadophora gregata]|uniref:uncharacterized protein n=1 Tax=Cadophora gregata TaxID=51156 RepID=UPI0026DB313B|nr:uncharacterized protein ONS95_007120 [Cadophora gregata]KAK0100668.1 hypothetical protein ONS95_007120 [Cadophora gregata]
MGADISSRNTQGQTFLHTLFLVSEFEDLPKYINLPRYLKSMDFAFDVRDYHGRTPTLQLFEQASKLSHTSPVFIKELFSIVPPQIDVMDNQGHTIGYHLFKLRNIHVSSLQAGAFLLTYAKSALYGLSFQGSISEHDYDWQSWLVWLSKTRLLNWVDIHGETALLAMLKLWRCPDDDDLSLPGIIQGISCHGADIHARDGIGDTALVVAVTRGLRPAAQKLLSMGASVYSVGYNGRGVLQETTSRLYLAQQEDRDGEYAKILSCVALLVDHNVPQFPEKIHQWTVQSTTQASLLESINITKVAHDSGFI